MSIGISVFSDGELVSKQTTLILRRQRADAIVVGRKGAFLNPSLCNHV